MLKRVSPDDTSGAMVRLGDVKTAAPFVSGLEYGAPARGVWNIVHIGMLLPGAHQIYVCAGNCLARRGAHGGGNERAESVLHNHN